MNDAVFLVVLGAFAVLYVAGWVAISSPDEGRSVLARKKRPRERRWMSALRLVLLFVVTLALTGCPGPNYAPYDNMNNNSPG